MKSEFNCTYCTAPMEQKDGEFGKWWSCSRWPRCDSKVGAHKDGRPLGTSANSELRLWRNIAHRLFDPMWMDNKMSRKDAYAWLFESTGVAHIGETDVARCMHVVRAIFEQGRGTHEVGHEAAPRRNEVSRTKLRRTVTRRGAKRRRKV